MKNQFYDIPGYEGYQFNPVTVEVKSLAKDINGVQRGERLLAKFTHRRKIYTRILNKSFSIKKLNEMIFPHLGNSHSKEVTVFKTSELYPSSDPGIVQILCANAGLNFNEVKTRTKISNNDAVKVRIVWKYLFEHKWHPTKIAKMFNKDRTSIYNGLERADEELKLYDDSKVLYEKLNSFKF